MGRAEGKGWMPTCCKRLRFMRRIPLKARVIFSTCRHLMYDNVTPYIGEEREDHSTNEAGKLANYLGKCESFFYP